MPKIHPTALVSSEAQLAHDVEVGPFAIIEDGSIISGGCKIDSHAKVCRGVTLGEENHLGHGAVLGGDPQDLGFSPETSSRVVTGRKNIFRENVTVNRGSKEGSQTTLGDDNFIMAGAHLAHDVKIGHRNVIANNAMIAGHAVLRDHTFIAGGAGIHQFVRVGSHVMLQGNCGVTKDVPPYCIAHQINRLSGLNSIGLRRAGFSAEERLEIKRAYRLLFQNQSSREQILQKLDRSDWSAPAWTLIEAYINPSSRGILRR